MDRTITIVALLVGIVNRERIQKELGWLSPDEYETAWHAATSIDEPDPVMLQAKPTPIR